MALPYATVFDLDDTLYLEHSFVRSGFRASGVWFETATSVAGLGEQCVELFEAGQRTQVFDAALEALGVGGDKDLVAQLVEVYRTHTPEITLATDAERYLRRRSAKRLCGLITDGYLATQMTKVQVLGLDGLLDHVICTGSWGRNFWKPHPRAFEAIEAWSGTLSANLAYIADNPTKDFVTPKARGWLTVQIARPERVHHVEAPDAAHEPHAVISSLDALDDCLAGLGGSSLAPAPNLRAGG